MLRQLTNRFRNRDSSRALLDVFEQEYLPQMLRAKTKSTIKNYKTSIVHLHRFLGRPPKLGDFKDATIIALLEWRLAQAKPATVVQNIGKLLTLWRWCAHRRYVPSLPGVELDIEFRNLNRLWNRNGGAT